jgi:hypothetical protein
MPHSLPLADSNGVPNFRFWHLSDMADLSDDVSSLG